MPLFTGSFDPPEVLLLLAGAVVLGVVLGVLNIIRLRWRRSETGWTEAAPDEAEAEPAGVPTQAKTGVVVDPPQTSTGAVGGGAILIAAAIMVALVGLSARVETALHQLAQTAQFVLGMLLLPAGIVCLKR